MGSDIQLLPGWRAAVAFCWLGEIFELMDSAPDQAHLVALLLRAQAVIRIWLRASGRADRARGQALAAEQLSDDVFLDSLLCASEMCGLATSSAHGKGTFSDSDDELLLLKASIGYEKKRPRWVHLVSAITKKVRN